MVPIFVAYEKKHVNLYEKLKCFKPVGREILGLIIVCLRPFLFPKILVIYKFYFQKNISSDQIGE